MLDDIYVIKFEPEFLYTKNCSSEKVKIKMKPFLLTEINILINMYFCAIFISTPSQHVGKIARNSEKLSKMAFLLLSSRAKGV